MTANRENCFYLNETIRNTVKVLMLLAETGFRPVTAIDVAAMTNLPEEFCQECLINFAFDELIRETDQGFQTVGLDIRKLDRAAHRVLTQFFTNSGAPAPRVRLRSGEWAR